MSRSSRINAGQVATVMVVAQINPLRNGSSVKKLPANSMPITTTHSTIRVISLVSSDRTVSSQSNGLSRRERFAPCLS
jgi:hypothetical protein